MRWSPRVVRASWDWEIFEGRAPTHASQVFSANLGNFLEHFWDKEQGVFNLDLEDEILKGCVLSHGGEIVHERFKNA